MVTVVTAAAVYVVLLCALRVVGRRSPNMMTPFEMILMFLLGGMGMQAILGEDRSFTNALTGIATILLMHVGVSTLKQRSSWFGKLADGTPVIVFADGKWDEEGMRRLRLQPQDVQAAARQQ